MKKQLTTREALVRASSLLEQNEIHAKIAEWLLLGLLQCSRQEWLKLLDQSLPAEASDRYFAWIERVLAGEPYQYVLGVQDFYGREFQVNPAVLIPRPETEMLVEEVLLACQEMWPAGQQLTAIDIGTGSGAIAITLALEQPLLTMMAVDVSQAALHVARTNAAQLGANVTFYESDVLQVFQDSEQKFDLVVSNPPYIAHREKEQVEENVLAFEPHLALFAEEEGLYFYRKIVEQAKAMLHSPAVLAFEVGFSQAPAVVTIIEQAFPQARCQIKQDLAGVERFVLAFLS